METNFKRRQIPSRSAKKEARKRLGISLKKERKN